MLTDIKLVEKFIFTDIKLTDTFILTDVKLAVIDTYITTTYQNHEDFHHSPYQSQGDFQNHYISMSLRLPSPLRICETSIVPDIKVIDTSIVHYITK